MNKKTVFLGGTCNGSTWRAQIIPKLKVNYFNPVVGDWNEKSQQKENEMKQICDFFLYVITPEMTGTFSIAEAVDSSNKNPEQTVFVILKEYDTKKFTAEQWRSLETCAGLVKNNGAKVYFDLTPAVSYINGDD